MNNFITTEYDGVGINFRWSLEGVRPKLIDWFWSNMEKGFLLWHTEEHGPLSWAIPPEHGNLLGAVYIAPSNLVRWCASKFIYPFRTF